MHRRLIVALVSAALVLSACGQDDDDGVISIEPEDLTPDATVAERTLAPTEQPTRKPAPDGDVTEVQGIIGVIDRDAGVITINPLQGTSIDRVRVDSGTEIRSARGGTITLGELRVSDRIIARGEVDGDELLADEISISQVVPGAEPGG